jgi:hypothetical protein
MALAVLACARDSKNNFARVKHIESPSDRMRNVRVMRFQADFFFVELRASRVRQELTLPKIF